VHTHEKKLYFVSTDSYRLAEKVVTNQSEDMSLIVPASALQEVLRIIADEDEEVKYSFDDGQIMFKLGEVEIISRLVDGKYPDYRQLIPKSNDIKIDIKRADFINITKVSSLFARESAGSITLHVSEDDQEVSIRSIASQVGENTSRASAKVTGSGEVTLNSRYLLDALNAFDGENVHMEFSGKINPCVITSGEPKNSDYLHIVMPLRS
jgi:DNA polymerase-3 subunit beta